MKENQIVDIDLPERGWDVYQYNYMFEFTDKIYISTIRENKLMTDVLDWESTIKNDELAGDIVTEVYPFFDDEKLTMVKGELIYHLENIHQAKIQDINLDLESQQDDAIKDFWINKQKPTEYNPLHTHGGIYSFVYYLDVSEKIRNEHKNQIGNTATRGLIQFLSSKTDSQMIFNPEIGNIFIFHHLHRHQVYPFYSDAVRITVAGNVHGIKFENGQIHGVFNEAV